MANLVVVVLVDSFVPPNFSFLYLGWMLRWTLFGGGGGCSRLFLFHIVHVEFPREIHDDIREQRRVWKIRILEMEMENFENSRGGRERERGDTRIKGCSVVFRLLLLLLLLLGRESKHRKDRNCFSERSAAPPDESLKIYPKFHVRPIFARTDWPRTGYISGDAGCIVLKPCDPSALPPPPPLGHVDFVSIVGKSLSFSLFLSPPLIHLVFVLC